MGESGPGGGRREKEARGRRRRRRETGSWRKGLCVAHEVLLMISRVVWRLLFGLVDCGSMLGACDSYCTLCRVWRKRERENQRDGVM